MSDPQVIDYIKKARAAGQKDEEIKFALFQNGWSEQEINENLLAVGLENRTADSFSKPEAEPEQVSPVQQNVSATPFDKPKRHWFVTVLITLAVIIFAGGAVFAFGKPLLNWLNNLNINNETEDIAGQQDQNAEPPEVNQENASFTPKLPDYTINFSELANIINFEESQNLSFSDDQKQALEEKNFFIMANYDKFYGAATVNANRNDDWTGLYKTIGGSEKASERSPENSVFITTDFLAHVYYKLTSSGEGYQETDDPNALVFSTMTQQDETSENTEQKLPSMPTALMVSSLMGSGTSEDLLNAWVQNNAEDSNEIITDKMATLQNYFNGVTQQQWRQNPYWSWLYAIKSLFNISDAKGYPMFMKSEEWGKKTLQSYLGSWTELKHDTLISTKQTLSGTINTELQQDEGEPAPVPKGYVEPNIDFLDRMIQLTENNDFKETLQFYKKIAVAELQNEKISDEDFEKLRLSAGQLENILQAPDSQTQSESNVRSALIIDAYTDTETQQILYEANGVPNYIFVAIKDANGTRLTKGLVYSYYEFTDSVSKKLDDQSWQKFNYSDSIKKLKMQDWNKALIK